MAHVCTVVFLQIELNSTFSRTTDFSFEMINCYFFSRFRFPASKRMIGNPPLVSMFVMTQTFTLYLSVLQNNTTLRFCVHLFMVCTQISAFQVQRTGD